MRECVVTRINKKDACVYVCECVLLLPENTTRPLSRLAESEKRLATPSVEENVEYVMLMHCLGEYKKYSVF